MITAVGEVRDYFIELALWGPSRARPRGTQD